MESPWGTHDPTSSPAPNKAVGFGANAETSTSESSRGAILGTSGYADQYLMLLLWRKIRGQSSLKGLSSGWSMQEDLPPLPGHKQKNQPSGRDLISPLHHLLRRIDGNPAPQQPEPGIRDSRVNLEAGEEEPGRIKGTSQERSTPDGSHRCGFPTARVTWRAALPAHSRSHTHCLAPQHDRGKRCPHWLFACLCHGCKQQPAYRQCQKIAIYLPRVNSTSRDLQGIAATNLRPNKKQIFNN